MAVRAGRLTGVVGVVQVDGSVAAKQGIRFVFSDGSRIIFRISVRTHPSSYLLAAKEAELYWAVAPAPLEVPLPVPQSCSCD